MPKRIPSYRLHKQSGQAIVTLTDPAGTRKDVLLGKFDTPESRAEYARVIAEWETNGRRLVGPAKAPEDISVNEVLLRYYAFAEGYYVKNGKPTKQLERVRRSLRFVKELYGHTQARQFGPLALKAVRDQMIGKGWSRVHINHCTGCITRCFKWAVENELVPPSVFQGLSCVAGLKRGRTAAKEGGRVMPVADATLESTLPYLTGPVAALVKVQRLTGMRPGETIIMRPMDIDRSGDLWIYRPESHKTQHHGHQRVVVLGKKCQEILTPFLFRDPDAFLFCPREAMTRRAEQLRAGRKTRVQPSQKNRRKRRPRKLPGDRYTTESYGAAIRRAVIRANKDRACDSCKKLAPADRCKICQENTVPHWFPHQLRHSHATDVRKRFGLEAAQVALGHANASVTELYAERDMTLAEKIAREVG